MAPLTNWQFLFLGYALTVLIESPILWFGLHPSHSASTRGFAALWLTACTYPIVILTLPALLPSHYTLAAEAFAPLAEIAAFHALTRTFHVRDAAAIALANLASFAAGLLLFG
jgi:hypothetical protein